MTSDDPKTPVDLPPEAYFPEDEEDLDLTPYPDPVLDQGAEIIEEGDA